MCRSNVLLAAEILDGCEIQRCIKGVHDSLYLRIAKVGGYLGHALDVT